MTSQASLPMYDFRELRAANEAWWSGIASHMRRMGINNVPAKLQQESPVHTLWQHPHLFMSQCCGFDVVFGYKDKLSPLLVTDWDVEGCDDGQYSSWIVVHENSKAQQLFDLKGCVAAINGPESHSGMHALLALVQPLSQQGVFFNSIIESGAHISSLSLLQHRHVDVAAIDCVTYALLKAYRPTAIEGTRIIGQTKLAPAHPYVTRRDTPNDTKMRMQEALDAAFHDHSLAAARDEIRLKKGLFKRDNDYQKIVNDFHYDPRLLEVLIRN